MFADIKSALQESKKGGQGAWRELLKMEKDKTYVVRLLPNMKDLSKTFFDFISYQWESFETGEFINAFSPETYNESCPIGDYRRKIYRNGTPEEKEKSEQVKRRTQHYVNVFVVSDPTNPENEGQIKILRYANQLAKIIDAAIDGEDEEEFGERIFDVSENGCNLRIKVENQGGYPTYVSSRFVSPSAIDIPDDWADQLHDLETIEERRSYDELVELFNEHFHMDKTRSETSTSSDERPMYDADDEDDELPHLGGESSDVIDSDNDDVDNNDEDDSPEEDASQALARELLDGIG